MNYFISADIGTQGEKVALVDERGRIAAAAFRPSKLIRRAGGSVEQNPDDMFESVLLGIRETMERSSVPPSAVAAISLDGQMAGILGIDGNWEAVTPYDSWLDSRCESEIPAFREWGEASLIRITGCPVTYAHGPKKRWWKRFRPDVYNRIAKFVVPSAFVAGKLAGLTARDAFIDHTHLHFAGFADVSAMEWSGELLREFGMDADKMPRIVRPWDVVGKLKREYAERTGLPEGIPIMAGCGDTAAAAFGAGLTRPGRLLDIAGTASVLACAVEGYYPDTETKTLIYARSVLPDLWAPLAYINGGGECLAWYRRLIGAGSPAEPSYDELNRLAESVEPGCDGLLFIPHFGGRVCPNDTDMRGSWLGLNWAHDRASMYRAMLEAVAFEYKLYLNVLERLSGPIGYSGATVVGGGAGGELFNRIKADVLGVPLRTLAKSDSALTGNAAIAGYGIGLYADLAEAAESFVAFDRLYEPDAERVRTYSGFAERYRLALEGMSELYGTLKSKG